MKFNKYLICALFLVLICCIGAASAADAGDDVVAANDTIDEAVSEAVDVSDVIDEEPLGVEADESALSGDETNSNDDAIEVWVNQNVSSNGDGSKENPFSNLQDAHDKIINSSSKKAIINIADGEYQIPCKIKASSSDPDFAFTDINLTVNGLGDNVILSADDRPSRTFHINTGSNLTINNIIFNISCVKWDVAYGFDRNTNKAVSLTNSFITVTNCTFTFKNKYVGLVRNEYAINYVDCIFINAKDKLFTSSKGSAGQCNFENCIFLNPIFSDSTKFITDDGKITINKVWLGTNTLPNMDTTCLEKYAVFTVSENYLGNNNYEIVGKLAWNGTDSSEGMENFPPMTVTLTSTTGEIQNATLINGTFKVNYTSISSENKITAKLDLEEINLTFANIDLGLNAPTISYGDNQNITVTFPQKVNGTVTVTVNGKDYPRPVNDSYEITVSISDVLTVGSHEVNVTFVDEKNHIYGFNTTTITISSINTKITALNVSTTYNVTKDLVVTLTDAKGSVLANKTVNIVVGTINKNLNTSEDGKISIDISTLSPDTYIANIIFAGDEIYAESSTTATVVVKEDIKTNITIPEISVGKATTTTIKLPENATGNITVTIDGKVSSVVNLTNGTATITIPELSAGKHDVVISYSGDGNYAGFSQNSTVTVKEQAKPTPTPANVKKAKQTTKIVAKKKTFKAKTKVKKYTITLKAGKKTVKNVQVTLKIGKKTYKAKTNSKGKATFKIKKLTKKGKYTATIKFSGNTAYKAATTKVKITIKK